MIIIVIIVIIVVVMFHIISMSYNPLVNVQKKTMENQFVCFFFWGGGKSTVSMAIFNSYVSLPEGHLIQW